MRKRPQNEFIDATLLLCSAEARYSCANAKCFGCLQLAEPYGDNTEPVDAETICAKIEGLGGVVIDKYDPDAVSDLMLPSFNSAPTGLTSIYKHCIMLNVAHQYLFPM